MATKRTLGLFAAGAAVLALLAKTSAQSNQNSQPERPLYIKTVLDWSAEQDLFLRRHQRQREPSQAHIALHVAHALTAGGIVQNRQSLA